MHPRFCFTLLAIASLAISSPIPAPADPGVAAIIASNLNLGCQNGCGGASTVQQLNTNAAHGSAVSPLSVFGGLVLASAVLAIV